MYSHNKLLLLFGMLFLLIPSVFADSIARAELIPKLEVRQQLSSQALFKRLERRLSGKRISVRRKILIQLAERKTPLGRFLRSTYTQEERRLLKRCERRRFRRQNPELCDELANPTPEPAPEPSPEPTPEPAP
ncbi:MAG: hypothetical protein ACO3XO_08175, partial [Bdellovibrionota bacterium]